jgi:hypothetical protein
VEAPIAVKAQATPSGMPKQQQRHDSYLLRSTSHAGWQEVGGWRCSGYNTMCISIRDKGVIAIWAGVAPDGEVRKERCDRGGTFPNLLTTPSRTKERLVGGESFWKPGRYLTRAFQDLQLHSRRLEDHSAAEDLACVFLEALRNVVGFSIVVSAGRLPIAHNLTCGPAADRLTGRPPGQQQRRPIPKYPTRPSRSTRGRTFPVPCADSRMTTSRSLSCGSSRDCRWHLWPTSWASVRAPSVSFNTARSVKCVAC